MPKKESESKSGRVQSGKDSKEKEIPNDINWNTESEEIKGDFAPIWNPMDDPDAPREIEGTITKIGIGQFGTYAQLKPRGEDEDIMLPAHKMLQTKLEKLAVDDYIYVKYLGQTKLASGRKASDYEVRRYLEI